MLYANSNRRKYGVKNYVLNTYDDIETLNKRLLNIGDVAFIIETSKHYILNDSREWKEIKPFGSGGGTSDWPDEIIYDGGSVSDSGDDQMIEVIYDGGVT